MAITLSVSNAWSEIKMGILAQRGPEIALKEWGALGDYLSGQLGEKVTIVPVKFSDFMSWCDQERSAFIFANPWFYVRTKILETMQGEGKINLADFVILNATKHEGFSELCSTPLYPDWPVASLGETSPELAAKMKEVLLAIPPGHPALEQARKIDSFVDALDYEPMKGLCRFLNTEPYRRMR